MGKIHTHYDNLKVARMAPQEVIRAAYKALSQKYHPDKNPGDEKAARIMAILNSAYDTLSDGQRRREHDEWIAAEEWEIEWLESTRHEDGRGGDKHRQDGPDKAWPQDHIDEPRAPRRRRRDWTFWAGLAACLALGWAGGVTMVAEPHLLSAMMASAWGGKGDLAAGQGAAPHAAANADGRADSKPDNKADSRADNRADNRADKGDDGWAVARPAADGAAAIRPAPIKVLALSHVVLPGANVDCDSEAQTLVAPNGEPWPRQSGYVDGFPVANRGDEVQLTLDNAGNASAVFIKVYDMERHSNVRYAFVQAHDKMVVDKLSSGRYEIRYQNLDQGATQGACPPHRTAAATEAAPVNN